MKRRKLIARLQADGYRLVRDNGKHAIYQKPGAGPVSVPRHNEINEKTSNAILKISGLL